MSLYIEASSVLTETSGSLKSRIYHRHSSLPPLKSPHARLYALIIETLKHQELLNEVIEKSGILALERKVCRFPQSTQASLTMSSSTTRSPSYSFTTICSPGTASPPRAALSKTQSMRTRRVFRPNSRAHACAAGTEPMLP